MHNKMAIKFTKFLKQGIRNRPISRTGYHFECKILPWRESNPPPLPGVKVHPAEELGNKNHDS